jgi:hypothetical protein
MRYQVLIADYAWPSLTLEQTILRSVGADLIVAQTGQEAELIELAPRPTLFSPIVNPLVMSQPNYRTLPT